MALPADALVGAVVMVAAAAVVAAVSTAAASNRRVGLAAAGTLVVLWAAAAFAPFQVVTLLAHDRGAPGILTSLCSQLWFTVAAILAVQGGAKAHEPHPA